MIDVSRRVCAEHGGAADRGRRRRGSSTAALSSAAVRCAAVVPPFVRPGEAGCSRTSRRSPRRRPVPLVDLPHPVPDRAGPVGAATLRALAALPDVAGVKYAVGGIDAGHRGAARPTRRTFAVLGATTCSSRRCWRSAPPAASWPRRTWPPGEFAELAAAWRAATPTGARRWATGSPAVGRPVRRAQPDRHQGRAARPGPDPDPGRAAAAARPRRRRRPPRRSRALDRVTAAAPTG